MQTRGVGCLGAVRGMFLYDSLVTELEAQPGDAPAGSWEGDSGSLPGWGLKTLTTHSPAAKAHTGCQVSVSISAITHSLPRACDRQQAGEMWCPNCGGKTVTSLASVGPECQVQGIFSEKTMAFSVALLFENRNDSPNDSL